MIDAYAEYSDPLKQEVVQDTTKLVQHGQNAKQTIYSFIDSK